jgi:hypothetical protein
MVWPGTARFLHNGIRRALGLEPPGRSLQIFPDDVFLVSYPKSGSTWARFLLGNLIFPNTPVTFANIHMLVPALLSTPRKDIDRVPRPRFIKSHECFDPLYPRIIYIVRDPRDVVLSLYHYHRKVRKIADDLPIETFAKQFLAGETVPHGSWGQNVMTWLTTMEGDPRFLMLRYEDLLVDTERELRKIVRFLALDTTAAQITQAVERSSAARMRELEKAQGKDLDRMVRTKTRKDLMFVRTAVSGGWRKDLPMAMVEKIETAWGPVMRHLGYELATQTLSDARLRVDWSGPQVGFGPKAELQRDVILNRT